MRALAVLACYLAAASFSEAAALVENFSRNPALDGFKIFGNTNQFTWNSTNQNLEVTWDSTQPNSYFYYPLGESLTRRDDFSVEFDLVLKDIAAGVEPGKTGPIQLGFGFLNSNQATNDAFQRGSFGNAPNVAEFDYYAAGYYDFGGFIYNSAATATPGFISGVNSYHYAPTQLSVYDLELPLNLSVHARLAYSGVAQTATLTLSTNGLPILQLPDLVLDPSHGFASSDDFHVDMFSISSYSSAGDDYDSVLAHGTVAHLSLDTQVRPVAALTGGFDVDGHWQAQFFSRTNWLYTLERTTNFSAWDTVAGPVPGADGALMSLQDNAPLPNSAFYRVLAKPQ